MILSIITTLAIITNPVAISLNTATNAVWFTANDFCSAAIQHSANADELIDFNNNGVIDCDSDFELGA